MTEARINPTTGIAEHRHAGNANWHWACAGHRDSGQLHNSEAANAPFWASGGTQDDRDLYAKALVRDILHRIGPKHDIKDYTVEYQVESDRHRFPWP